MPIVGGLVFVIQICFAYHALKSGRPYWWLFVIMAFPVMGCLLYYFIEVFPSSRESRSAHKAARAIARAFDPDKDLRTLVADVDACGSVENRMHLARECMEQGMHAEAEALFRSCLNGIHETDPDLRYGLARALLFQAKHDEALVIASRLRASHPTFRANEVGLVVARALEGTSRFEEALAQFGVLASSYPGEEGRWRYGALLARLGRVQDAREVFRRMLNNAERQPRHYRDAQKSWLDLARESMQA
jgi:hypothetical protein